MKLGPYTILGAKYPYYEDHRTKQSRAEDGEGGVVVYETTWDAHFFRVKFKVSGRGNANDIRGYLRNGLRYSANTLTYVDDHGNMYLVRFWDHRIMMAQVAPGVYEFDLMLRREVA